MMKTVLGLIVFTFLFGVEVSGQEGQNGQSFTLAEAQAYAVENSYQTRTAMMDVEASKKKVSETIAIGLPQITAGGSYQNFLELPVQLVPAEFFGGNAGEFAEVIFGTEQNMGVRGDVSQLLFDGSYFVGLQAARVYLDIAKNDKVKSDIEIKNAVTIAYGQVLISERNAEILANNLKNLEKNLYETTETYNAGFAEEQDRDQMALLVANTKNAMDNARRQVEISKNLLKFQMGMEIAQPIQLSENLDQMIEISSPDGFLEKDFNVNSHIDYKIVSTQEQATKLLWKQQKSNYLPKLNASYSYQQNSFSNEFNFFGDAPWFPTQVIGLNLSVPIFTSFSRKYQVQQAKIEYDKVGLAKKQVEESLLLGVSTARSDYQYALSSYNTQKDNMALAERIYNKTKTKYEEGISTSLELTQANNQLLDTQGAYINAAFQLINAKTNLDKALNNY